MSHAKIFIVLFSCVVFVGALSTRAQDIIGSASTDKGDISRGQGVFLKGKGIYELYSATGRQIDARTEIMVQQWNRQVHGAYAVERAARMQSKKNLSAAQQAVTKQKMAEKEKRLRTNPKVPKVIDRVGVNAKKQPVTFLGIYDWVNDGLRICFSVSQRPTEIGAQPGSGRVLQVWGRTNP